MDIRDLFLGTFQQSNSDKLRAVIKKALDLGVRGFDTAPSYKTETILGSILNKELTERKLERLDLKVSDKVDAWQMQESDGKIEKYIKKAIDNMQLEYIDILYIHWPIPEYLEKTWECMAELKNNGLIKKIGISNVRVRHLESLITSTGIKPDYVQIERHPLRTAQEEVNYCLENNIKVQAYSPLCRMDNRLIENKALQDIAINHNKNIGQIILRWHIDTGVAPVFMTKNENRIKENCELFDFRLTNHEIELINNMNINFKIFLESVGCPGF